MRVRTTLILSGLILALTTAARAADMTLVGTPSGAPQGTRIGIVTDGSEFLAYACSPDAAFVESCARWFRGPVGPDGAFAAEADGAAFKAGSPAPTPTAR
jgi:hypothetical protein